MISVDDHYFRYHQIPINVKIFFKRGMIHALMVHNECTTTKAQ
jgi:hypothetical protein